MRSRGCWTCRGRKVLCDEAQPGCQRCAQSNRKCQGYGVRLSWPQSKSRRSIVGGSARGPAPARSRHPTFLNTGFQDIEIHRHLSASLGRQGQNESGWGAYLQTSHPRSIPWKPFQLQSSEMDLLAYFESVASSSLATFDYTRSELRSLLFRLALLDTTPSSKCVLWSMLALSALHRHGYQYYQTAHLNMSAVHLLTSSSAGVTGSSDIVRHLAANMLLCISEIQAGKETATQWCWFLCGSGTLMRSITADLEALGTDGSMLRDWVCYHGALANFSLRHWHRMAAPKTPVGSGDPRTKLVRPPPVCSSIPNKNIGLPDNCHSFLTLIRDVLRSALRPSQAGYHDEAYASSLQILERRVQSISNHDGTSSTEVAQPIRGWVDTSKVELYKLALLIYLEREARRFSGQSDKITSYTNRAFAILSQMDFCDLPFPLFMIGCEAQSDEQRMVILRLARKEDAAAQPYELTGLERMLEAVWAQDDLETERELDYTMKLDVVMTSSPYLPSFA